jgi:hypothetical protein
MSVGVECNLDAGVAHLVANVGGGFALSDQLAREEVSQGRREAIIQLDEWAGAEPSWLVPMDQCMIDFRLNDQAEIEVSEFGEETTDLVWERCYPALRVVLSSDDAMGSGVGERTKSGAEMIKTAVEHERKRLRATHRREAIGHILAIVGAALIGLTVAASGLFFSEFLESSVPDSIASLAIGVLLAVTVFGLARPFADDPSGGRSLRRCWRSCTQSSKRTPRLNRSSHFVHCTQGPEEVVEPHERTSRTRQ